MKIELGNKVKDVISEFTGIVTAKIENLNGSVRYLIEPKCIDGEMQSGEYIDEYRLEKIDEGIKNHTSKKVGFKLDTDLLE